MDTTDPTTVHQLRTAALIEADQRRAGLVPVPTRPRRRRAYAEWLSSLRRRRTESTLERYRSHDLFVDVDPRTLRRLSESFFVIDVEAGDSLGRQGDVVPEFVVVLDGRIGVAIDGVPLAVLDSGSHFGALPLLDDGPMPYSRASFNVLGPGTIAVANRSQFHEIMSSYPVVADRIRAIADVRRAYLAGRADAGARAVHEDFPLHIAGTR